MPARSARVSRSARARRPAPGAEAAPRPFEQPSDGLRCRTGAADRRSDEIQLVDHQVSSPQARAILARQSVGEPAACAAAATPSVAPANHVGPQRDVRRAIFRHSTFSRSCQVLRCSSSCSRSWRRRAETSVRSRQPRSSRCTARHEQRTECARRRSLRAAMPARSPRIIGATRDRAAVHALADRGSAGCSCSPSRSAGCRAAPAVGCAATQEQVEEARIARAQQQADAVNRQARSISRFLVSRNASMVNTMLKSSAE